MLYRAIGAMAADLDQGRRNIPTKKAEAARDFLGRLGEVMEEIDREQSEYLKNTGESSTDGIGEPGEED